MTSAQQDPVAEALQRRLDEYAVGITSQAGKDLRDLARDAIAALRRLQAAQREPVAWRKRDGELPLGFATYRFSQFPPVGDGWEPLYTHPQRDDHPPQRFVLALEQIIAEMRLPSPDAGTSIGELEDLISGYAGDLARILADVRRDDHPRVWKCGNEFAPFHPDASHVSPDYRDGWNACFAAARPARGEWTARDNYCYRLGFEAARAAGDDHPTEGRIPPELETALRYYVARAAEPTLPPLCRDEVTEAKQVLAKLDAALAAASKDKPDSSMGHGQPLPSLSGGASVADLTAKNAARYEWLRANGDCPDFRYAGGPDAGKILWCEKLDAAIDAAMSADVRSQAKEKP